MYGRDFRPLRRAVIRMDPDCAICHAPATMACECEAKGLEYAIKEAEELMMKSIYSEIRKWVRGHAQDYILEYFRQLAEHRKAAHTAHMDHLHSQARYFYGAPPHPDQIADAQSALKRGIDEDWQASVARYPEVLQYFYGLVELTLPADDEPAVKDPPLNVPSSRPKPGRRQGPAPPSITPVARPPSIGPPSYRPERGGHRPRTPSASASRPTPAPQLHMRQGGYGPAVGHPPQPAGPPYYSHAPYIN